MKAHKSFKIKIGVKYCGGCNPGYNRVAYVELFEKTFSNVELISYQDHAADSILVVTGCSTACVDTSQFRGKNYLLLTDENDFRTAINQLSKKIKAVL